MDSVETTNQTQPSRELRVEKWIYGGDGLGWLDGRVVLVPFVLPGEVALIEIAKEKADLLQARAVEILSPSVERTEPRCPYFARCGGCHYQHARYEIQLAQKRSILAEVLRRVGKLDPPEEIRILAGSPWEYRNRTQFHLAGGDIGFWEAGSHRLCPVEHCPISSPRINQVLAGLRALRSERRFPRFVWSIEVFTNETDVLLHVAEVDHPNHRKAAREFLAWCAERIQGVTGEALEYRAAGELYRVSRYSFFQVNRFLIDALVECALEGAAGERVIDLYAGVGLFSLPLARRFPSVTAVESGVSAAGDLAFNAQRAGLLVNTRPGVVETFLRTVEKAPDFLLADPPRAGLGQRVVKQLLRLRPPRLTIVACDPATLARDLAPLTAAGYRIERLTLVDLFPQTYHIETVAHMRL